MANQRRPAVITPDQLLDWQTRMELGDKAAAVELGVSAAHFSRLKSGHTPISKKTYNALVGVEARASGFKSLLDQR